jgi:hypothetical protein
MAGADADSGLLLAESEVEHRGLLAARTIDPARSPHPAREESRGRAELRGGPFPLLNRPDWRLEDEPVKHKVLDLLGDLALAGLALPRAEIEIRNGGHGVNHQLLARLLAAGPGPIA